MAEALAVSPEVPGACRVDLRDLADMPMDMVVFGAAIADLNPRQLGVWARLMRHIYVCGELPTGMKALAKIAGVGVASFERMAPALARHFDNGPQGRWSDHHLVRSRGTRLVFAEGTPSVDPRISQMRSEIGSRGGKATQRLKREQALHLVRSEGDAHFASNFEANQTEQTHDFASSNPENPEANASRGQGLSVCLVESESKILEQTDQQTNQTAARAGASGQATTEANFDADRAMIKQMVTACTFDGPAALDDHAARKRLPKIRELIAKGCSFERDYLPELRDFARGKVEVTDCANKWICEATFDRRDHNLHEQHKGVSAADGIEFKKVYLDDPGNAAALAAIFEKRPYLKETRHPPERDEGGPYRRLPIAVWLEASAKVGSPPDAEPSP